MRTPPNEEIKFRVTQVELMNLKNGSFMSSAETIRHIFNERYPNKEIIEKSPITVDPDYINDDAVVVSVIAREKVSDGN
jgi:hypothetical protein